MQPTNEDYKKVQKLIKKEVWKYYKKWASIVEFEDLEAQANYIFCKCFQDYQESKSCFYTFLTNQLKRLNNYCLDLKKQEDLKSFSNRITKDYIKNEEVKITMENFSKETKLLLQYAFTKNIDMLEGKRKKITREKLFKLINQELNWSIYYFQKVWEKAKKEIKELDYVVS